jgi:hypothetical protein
MAPAGQQAAPAWEAKTAADQLVPAGRMGPAGLARATAGRVARPATAGAAKQLPEDQAGAPASKAAVAQQQEPLAQRQESAAAEPAPAAAERAAGPAQQMEATGSERTGATARDECLELAATGLLGQ